MSRDISADMYDAAVEQARQVAARAAERDLAWARHTAQALDLLLPPLPDDPGLVREDRSEWT